jgi:hypothetical protein
MGRKTAMATLVAVAALALMASCNLFVKAPTLESLAVSKSTVWMFTSSSPVTVTLKGNWSDGTQTDISDATWTSSAPAVATVSNGVITPIAVGTATVTATKEGKSVQVAVNIVAPGPFADPELRYYRDQVETPTNQKVMIAGWENSASYEIANDGVLTATFQGYPDWWGGGIGIAQKPVISGVTVSGYFDFTNVKTVSFEIKSATLTPSNIGYFIQWLSETDGKGGEHVIWLNDAGVTNITNWTQVSIDLSNVPNDGRYGKNPEDYANAKAYVDTAFAMRWQGNGSQNGGGPLTVGDNFEIRNIAFKDASGNEVKFWTGINY